MGSRRRQHHSNYRQEVNLFWKTNRHSFELNAFKILMTSLAAFSLPQSSKMLRAEFSYW